MAGRPTPKKISRDTSVNGFENVGRFFVNASLTNGTERRTFLTYGILQLPNIGPTILRYKGEDVILQNLNIKKIDGKDFLLSILFTFFLGSIRLKC